MQVREVMTKSPVCCPPDMPLRDVAKLMVQYDCGEIPVVDRKAQRPVGVVTDRDITCRTVAEGKNPMELSAKDCMTSPVVTVTPDTPVEDCCRAMEEHQIRRVPVVDEAGSCCGIVSQADIALRAPRNQAAAVVKGVSKHGATPAQPEAAMATDPVCGMQVPRSNAPGGSETFGGETYHFCSADCRQTFNQRPEDYVSPA